ncbi:MAG: haloacid dehalogenase-like hydrolase [Rhabdochlamydiaceae bacterium]|nr:haloacid dehalogenase-like hydrolase [Candidatus Amphrikana amoebophyrae]
MEIIVPYSRIALFDLDRTLLDCNISMEFYLFLIKKKCIPVGSVPVCLLYYIKHRYFEFPLINMHHIVFDQFLLKRSSQLIFQYIDEFVEMLLPGMLYMPAFIELKRAIHLGHYTAILTSTPKFIAEPIAKSFGVHALYATEYAIDDKGDFCSISRIIEGGEKAKITSQIQKELDIATHRVSAYSDSFHDIDFLCCSGEKIAVNPDKRLKSYSLEKNWKII